ncbi:M23 family metallopeptidase [Gulosibacter hominis]|uniref:M23 family metallopeptidase n=1 Tax=Gulosibacter hominis TaxID=2770504 RepID=UPI001918E4BB|nr:M23 family metallopeptidase [Gulosibacter hominis]
MRVFANNLRRGAGVLVAGALVFVTPVFSATAQPLDGFTVRAVDTDTPTEPQTPSEPETPTEPETPEAPTDPGVTDPGTTEPGTTEPDPSTPAPGESAPGTTAPDPGDTSAPGPTGENTPTQPGTPRPSASPTAPATDAPQYDLDSVDFVTPEDVDAAGSDPAQRSQLTGRALEQLELIDKALRESRERVNKAGERYATARDKADDARAEVKRLESRIENERNSAEVSDQVVGLMVREMRQGTYSVPPELNVVLEGGDDMLYRYGVVSSLTRDQVLNSKRATRAADRLEQLLPEADRKRKEAEQLETEAAAAKREAVAAQEWLTNQLKKAESSSDALLEVLTKLGYEGGTVSSELLGLLKTRNDLRALSDTELKGNGKVAQPLENWRVTDGYGYRTEPKVGMHRGTDFVVNGNTCGAPLYAMVDGTVTYAGALGTFGNHVEITTASGLVYSYSHIQDNGIGVDLGDKVRAGQPVALTGTTGFSTGCHLHLEVLVDGQHIDPMIWLRANGLA